MRTYMCIINDDCSCKMNELKNIVSVVFLSSYNLLVFMLTENFNKTVARFVMLKTLEEIIERQVNRQSQFSLPIFIGNNNFSNYTIIQCAT